MPLNKLKKFARLWVNSPIAWIFVASLPALILYVNRVLIPDFSTDTFSYHLFNGLRGLLQPFVPFLSAEFYPVGIANIAPGYDALQTIARFLLGYRLGTILSLLASVGSLIILYKILALLLKERGKKFNAGWGIVLVNAAVILEWYFQLATYFVDIINAFFVLLIFYLILRQLLSPKLITLKWWIGLWLGIGLLLALKLTNVATVLPLIPLLAWNIWRHKTHLKQLLLYAATACLFLLPLLPGWLQNTALSGNPVFPFYNNVFQSDYYSAQNFSDTNFGGTNTLEKLVWPVASINQQVRLGEPHHIYNDYKMPLYWVLGVGLAVLAATKWLQLEKAQKLVLYYFLASLFCNGLLFGINRYILPSLLLGGLLIAIALLVSYRPSVKKAAYVVMALICIGLVIENFKIIQFNLTYDMSWRPQLHASPATHREQLGHILDSTLDLSPAQQKVVNEADVLLNCSLNVSGAIALLPGSSNKPLVNIIGQDLPHYAGMSDDADYRRAVKEHLQVNKDSYSWVSVISPELDSNKMCAKNIAQRGGEITEVTEIDSLVGFKGVRLTLISGRIPL